MLLGFAALPLVRDARADQLCLALAAYALLQALLLFGANRFDIALIYHDRYNLASYIFLAVGGMLCWRHALRPVLRGWPRLRAGILTITIAFAVAHLFTSPVPVIDVMGENLPHRTVNLPSLKSGLVTAFDTVYEAPGGGRDGIGYDVGSQILPIDAVVATTVIDPYLLRRPFLQMLPVSENIIDLSLPPEQLRDALLAQHTTHLYLTEHSGLNAWMNPVVDRWLTSLRKVPELPAVRRLIYLNYPSGKGRQGFYELKAGKRSDDKPALRELSDLRLIREIDGTWTLRWQAEPGGDVRVNWRQAPGKTMLMGEAVTDLGQFPMRLGMPDAFVLDVILIVRGQAVKTVELVARRPK
jgi:hypothetical protein